jgi:hypothetical protein
MSSSTSSSDAPSAHGARRWPSALIAAIGVVVGLEALVGVTAPGFMESQPLIYHTKLGALDGALAGEVVFFGDSTTVASVRPQAVQHAFPEDLRVVNLAMPGSGPLVAELVLRRLLAEWPAPPRLVVLGFSTLSYTRWRINFVEYPLTHLLPFGSALGAARADRDPDYLLDWTAARLPSVRHREQMKSGALSLLFDRWPGLAVRYHALIRGELDAAQFRWRYRERGARNRRLAAELLRERGWRLFEEMRLPAGELDPGVRFDQGEFHFPPFEAAAREEQALVRLLDACEAHGIPVLVLPVAQPRAQAEALDLAGGDQRLDAFAARVFDGRPGVRVPHGLRFAWPHRYFADLAHVNEAGLARYTATIEPMLRETARAMRAISGPVRQRPRAIVAAPWRTPIARSTPPALPSRPTSVASSSSGRAVPSSPTPSTPPSISSTRAMWIR